MNVSRETTATYDLVNLVDVGSIPAASTTFPSNFNHLAHSSKGEIGLQSCGVVSGKAVLRQRQ